MFFTRRVSHFILVCIGICPKQLLKGPVRALGTGAIMANWDRDHLSSLGVNVKLPLRKGFASTQRIDNWWTEPFWMASALTIAVLYTGMRVLIWDGDIQYDNHRVTSPIFSPDVLHLLHITNHPGWMNSAMLILWIPFGFRGTCYYMRRVYHRTFFQNPTGCMIAKPELNYAIGYKGEKGLFILNNIHRYMLYLAILILSVKFYDVILTTKFSDGSRAISIGTLILGIESFLLLMYVTSCHAFRHLFGGGMNRWRGGLSGVFGSLYRTVSKVNVHHSFWFWTSLAMVFLGDLFVLAVAEDILSDQILLEW